MRLCLACVVVAVSSVSTVHAGPAIDVRLGDIAGLRASIAFRASVATKLEQSYLAGLKRCYLQERKVRTNIAVNRELVFAVDHTGKVTIGATSFDKVAHACVVKAAKSWKLGIPTDDAGDPVDATFTIHVDLGPALELDAAKFALLLAAEGPGPSEGDMSRRRPGAELGAELAKVQGSGGKGVGQAALGGTTTASAPTLRVSVVEPEAIDDTDLEAVTVLHKVRSAYLAGLKRCYKTRLAAAAGIRGRVVLNLTVNEAGRTVNGAARGFDSDLDRCITGLVQSWRFPLPHDRNGDATAASFSVRVLFAPE
jgi:hypothetical protein